MANKINFSRLNSSLPFKARGASNELQTKVNTIFQKMVERNPHFQNISSFNVYLAPQKNGGFRIQAFIIQGLTYNPAQLISPSPKSAKRADRTPPSTSAKPENKESDPFSFLCKLFVRSTKASSPSLMDYIENLFHRLFSSCSPPPSKKPKQTPPQPQKPVDSDSEEYFDADDGSSAPKISKPLPPLQGIRNTGNTCFMAAALQAILNDPVLTGAVLRHYKSRLAEFEREIGKGVRSDATYQAYQTLVKAIENFQSGKSIGNLTPLRGFDPKNQFGKKYSFLDLMSTSLGDATEFLYKILEPIQGIGCQFNREHTWVAHDQSTLTTRSVENNAFFIQLDVQHANGKNGQSLISDLFNAEEDSKTGTQITKRENGKVYNRKSTQLSLATVPDRFAVTLKRFNAEGKIEGRVEMPETLSMNGNHYRLKSIVVHQGSHYYSYLYREGKWYKADDSRISTTTQGQVNEGRQYGYVYFYEKN